MKLLKRSGGDDGSNSESANVTASKSCRFVAAPNVPSAGASGGMSSGQSCSILPSTLSISRKAGVEG